jgi:preprotein translocase subunit SecA
MLAAPSTPRDGLPKGLDAVWNVAASRVVGMVPRQGRYMQQAERVVAMESLFARLSDDRIREKAAGLREVFRLLRETRDDVFEACALIREVAHRTVGLKPYPVQIAAALAMHDGCVAEMATGEGKTLAATIPITLAGWRGRGCHVITVNDYLAARDDKNMSSIYEFCGLSSGHVDGSMEPPERRYNYQADITYCTNKEVTADFLRDRLSLGRRHGLSEALIAKIVEGRGFGTDRLVMRGLHAAIVDEADSILIDEAVTPLIISGGEPNAEQVETYAQASALAEHLVLGEDFKIDQRYREANLTEKGKARLARETKALGGIWAGRRRAEELVAQALTARELFQREKQYVKQDGKIVIVDEFTGRLMPDRTWRDGLHQAVEAKEGMEIQAPKETLARISFQRFFRLYRHLSGMTGTAWESRHELWQIYGLRTVVLPTHKPCIRVQQPDRIFTDAESKWEAVAEEIADMHRRGRPVLAGTRSVRASEELSRRLTEMGIEHQVLNAVRHAEEAKIVAQAGNLERVTVATNMAGRGTDIKLDRRVAKLGGLHVIATERHESGRVDRQLFGRAGRQGDPGSAVAFVSLDDELVQRYASKASRRILEKQVAGDRTTDSALVRFQFSSAQHRAEGIALKSRKSVLRSDDWLDEFLGFTGRD